MCCCRSLNCTILNAFGYGDGVVNRLKSCINGDIGSWHDELIVLDCYSLAALSNTGQSLELKTSGGSDSESHCLASDSLSLVGLDTTIRNVGVNSNSIIGHGSECCCDKHIKWCFGHCERVGALGAQVGRIIALQLYFQSHARPYVLEARNLCTTWVDSCLNHYVALGDLVVGGRSHCDCHGLARSSIGLIHDNCAILSLGHSNLLSCPCSCEAAQEHCQ